MLDERRRIGLIGFRLAHCPDVGSTEELDAEERVARPGGIVRRGVGDGRPGCAIVMLDQYLARGRAVVGPGEATAQAVVGGTAVTEENKVAALPALAGRAAGRVQVVAFQCLAWGW